MKADILQNCAELEEFFQEFYVGNYENLPLNAENKAEALELYDISKNYIWNPSMFGYGSLRYVITSDGYKCYFINKKGLPEEVRKNLKRRRCWKWNIYRLFWNE